MGVKIRRVNEYRPTDKPCNTMSSIQQESCNEYYQNFTAYNCNIISLVVEMLQLVRCFVVCVQLLKYENTTAAIEQLRALAEVINYIRDSLVTQITLYSSHLELYIYNLFKIGK